MRKGNGLRPTSTASARLLLTLTLLSAGDFGYAAQGQSSVQLDLERTIALPDGVYLSTYADRAADFSQGDTFAAAGAVGFPRQTIDWSAV